MIFVVFKNLLAVICLYSIFGLFLFVAFKPRTEQEICFQSWSVYRIRYNAFLVPVYNCWRKVWCHNPITSCQKILWREVRSRRRSQEIIVQIEKKYRFIKRVSSRVQKMLPSKIPIILSSMYNNTTMTRKKETRKNYIQLSHHNIDEYE